MSAIACAGVHRRRCAHQDVEHGHAIAHVFDERRFEEREIFPVPRRLGLERVREALRGLDPPAALLLLVLLALLKGDRPGPRTPGLRALDASVFQNALGLGAEIVIVDRVVTPENGLEGGAHFALDVRDLSTRFGFRQPNAIIPVAKSERVQSGRRLRLHFVLSHDSHAPSTTPKP